MSGNVFHNSGSIGNIGGDLTVGNKTAGRADLDAAVAELRSLIAELTRAGAVTADGTVRDPAAVVNAVQEQPSRFRALAKAIGAGAKDAVLSVVQGGVAAMIVALVGAL
jgi:hypothetical protein